MAKLPSFQFYPGDWMKDPNLRRCSPAARGVWIDMICLMFECDDRGVLASGADAWTLDDIACAVGGAPGVAVSCIDELVRKGVARRRADGALFSARLVRDEEIRRATKDRVSRHRNHQNCNGDVTQKKRSCTEDEDEVEESSESGGSVRGAGFDAWWDSYPHKIGKQAARKAYITARKQADAPTLLAGVAAYVASKPQDRPWCNPATWLNQGRWEDQPAVPGKAKPKTGLDTLTPDQLRDLHRFACGKHPEIKGMAVGQDQVRRAMRKCLAGWKDGLRK